MKYYTSACASFRQHKISLHLRRRIQTVHCFVHLMHVLKFLQYLYSKHLTMRRVVNGDRTILQHSRDSHVQKYNPWMIIGVGTADTGNTARVRVRVRVCCRLSRVYIVTCAVAE